MLIAVILGFFGVFVTLLGLAVGAVWYAERLRASYEARLAALLREWGSPGADGGPSQLASLVDAAGTVIGRAAAQSIMASVSASDAHVARVANGLADEVQGRQNPVLGLLAGGRRGKGAAVARLAELLGPLLSSAGSPAGEVGNNGHSSVRDRMLRNGG